MTASIDERALTARVGEVLNRWPVAGLAVGVIRDGSLPGFGQCMPVTRRSPAVVLSGCRCCWLRLGQCSGANRAVKCRSCRGWDTMRMPGSWAARLATRVTTSIT